MQEQRDSINENEPPNLEVRAVPYTPLADEEMDDLRRARKLLEQPSFAANMAATLGSPLERGFKMLPQNWTDSVQVAVRRSLFKALDVAVASINDPNPKKSSDLMHKVLVGASGTVGGAFGLASVAVELPFSTTIMLRSIAEIARSEGFDIKAIETKLNCLEVFALGGNEKQEGTDSSYWAVRATLGSAIKEAATFIGRHGVVEKTAPAMVRLVSAIATRFGVVVSEQIAAKAIPIVGAASGAVINVLFMDHFQNMARGHFIIKRLEAKYGEGTVESAYTRLNMDKKEANPAQQAPPPPS
ncbi:MAG: EcsC family protein [Verrucomicrobiales bacterium]